MSFADLIKDKKNLSKTLIKKYNLETRNKTFGLVEIKNKTLLSKLYFWFANLPSNFVVVWDFWKDWLDENFKNIYVAKTIPDDLLKSFDFVLSDSENTEINKYLSSWVAPIFPRDNHYKTILKEYNSIKWEGNSFLYDDKNEWSIFYSLARYLENHKFPFDNKTLVKNVFES